MSTLQKTLFVVLPVFILSIFTVCASTSKVSTDKLKEIKLQMTKETVIDIIGEPTYKRQKLIEDVFEVWKYDLYDNDGYRREFLFTFDKNGRLRNWNEKTGQELGPMYP